MEMVESTKRQEKAIKETFSSLDRKMASLVESYYFWKNAGEFEEVEAEIIPEHTNTFEENIKAIRENLEEIKQNNKFLTNFL